MAGRGSEDRTRVWLRAISELTADCCWVRHEAPGGASRREWITGSVERLTGYTEEEFERLDRKDFVHPDDLTEALTHVNEPLGMSSHEFRVVKRDGEVRWLHETMRVVERPDGSKVVYGATRDITARKRAEEALRRSLEERHQSQKLEALGKLAGGVAHDFNNLLTLIMGNAAMIKAGSREETTRLADEIQDAAERAESLTGQLLAFSRKQPLEPRVTDVNDLVERMSAMLRRLVREDIGIDLELDPDLGYVRIDPVQFEQVLVNLVANAQDSRPARIALETRQIGGNDLGALEAELPTPGPHVRISIRDDGHGMDSSTARRVFEPFFTTKAPGKGTGLGLAVAYGVIKQSAGHITVRSAPKSGTTFEIYLPTANGDLEPASTSTATSSVPGGTETVLLVEDEAMVRGLVRDVLEELGYRVLEARDADHAVRISDGDDRIDLLLTDVVMPGMGGPELATRIRERRGGIAVLFTSGYAGEALSATRELGPLLPKPFDPPTLATTVRRVLDDSQKAW